MRRGESSLCGALMTHKLSHKVPHKLSHKVPHKLPHKVPHKLPLFITTTIIILLV